MNILEHLVRTDYSPHAVDYADLDDTPDEYREQLIRLMSIQAYAELKAATEAVGWISQAPDFRRRRLLAKIVAEEAAHSALVYTILETIGVSETQANEIAEGRRGRPMHAASVDGPTRVGDEGNEWIDIMMNHMFLDRAGRFMVANFTEASFKPWAEANRIILRDETGHVAFGHVEVRQWLREQTDMDATAQRVSMWYARGLNFFGPPSARRAEALRAWGLKRRDNDQLRAAFKDEVEDLFAKLGSAHLLQLRRTEFPY